MTRKDPNAAAKKIFNPSGKTYLYSIKAIHRYSKEYNEKVGHISTGDPREDEKLMNEEVHVGGSIEDILRLYRKGVNVTFRDGKDMVEIYEVLVEHLNNWIEYINYDPNVKNAPLSALNLMEEFCQDIFDQVRGFRGTVTKPPKLKGRGNMLFGGLSRAEQAANPVKTLAESRTKHVPIMDRLEQLLNERNTPASPRRN